MEEAGGRCQTGGIMSQPLTLIPEIEDLERQGMFDAAFRLIDQRNQLERRGLDLSRFEALEIDRYAAYAGAFPSPLAIATGGSGSRAPIFIVGMLRSGSTLVEQILDAHSQVTALGETLVLGTTLFNDISWLRPMDVPASRLRQVSTTYLRLMRECGWRRTARFVDKSLGNFELLGYVHLLFPRATILHTVRDAVDTCLSAFRAPFDITPATKFTRELGHMGRHYVRYRRLMEHWRAVLPPGRLIEVRHEDLVRGIETGAQRLIEACGLQWEDRCLRFYESDRTINTASAYQVRRPIFFESVGRWRPYREFLDPLLEALGPYATEAGVG